jgi:hypothetical protein
MEATCCFETSDNFYGLHGVLSQKIELFITTAVRTSNPTSLDMLSNFGEYKICIPSLELEQNAKNKDNY